MTRTTRTATSAAVAALLLAVVSGCADDERVPGQGMGPMHGQEDVRGDLAGRTTGSDKPVSEQHNAADVAFAREMIPHHEQALVMIEMVERHGASDELSSMTETMAKVQAGEIGYLTKMLDVWGADQPGVGHGGGMVGMLHGADLDRLDAAHAGDFEAMWATMMIVHHEGAIEMARDEVADGANPEAVTLAEEIIEAQTAEIAQLEAIAAG